MRESRPRCTSSSPWWPFWLLPIPSMWWPLVRSLWLVQRHGTPEALDPKNDERVKAALSKALAKDGVITLKELGGFMQPDTFNKLAGSDATLDASETLQALEAATLPEPNEARSEAQGSRRLPGDDVRPDRRETPRGRDEARPTGLRRTTNLGSRFTSRSSAPATLAGASSVPRWATSPPPTAACPRFASTAAVRPRRRSIRERSPRSKAIGFEVEPTGKEAERGEPKTVNPIHRISWGEGFETHEFSKHYGDKANPQEGFAALMVCSEADEGPAPS